MIDEKNNVVEKDYETIKTELNSFLSKQLDKNGIPSIHRDIWIPFRNQYDAILLRKALSELIVENKYPFPYKEYDLEKDVKQTFYKLKKYDAIIKNEELPNNTFVEKHDYKNSYALKPLGIIPTSGGKFNSVSDYYHQIERMKVGSVYHVSPYDCWTTGKGFRSRLCVFWNDKMIGKRMDTKSFNNPMFTLTYSCSQFKPDVAKSVYVQTEAKTVVDLSCGWGDRLAGFFASNAQTYIGTDPNKETFENYKRQCLDYESFLGIKAELTEYDNYFICKGSKTVIIYNLPAEDVDWNQYKNEVDVIFTSPPYFDLEQYDKENEDQSWKRYTSLESWRDNFLFKIIDKSICTLKDSGYLMLNITEAKHPEDGYYLCDHMVDYVTSKNEMYYIGKIGMIISSRPNRDGMSSVVGTIEPIWCFRKGIDEGFKRNTIDSFF
jgi:hypothetical protein